MNDNNLFQNAFDAIDDELIAEAKSPAIYIATRRKKIIISSIAACIAAVLVAIPSIKVMSDLNDNKFTESDNIEIMTEYENASSEQSQSTDNPANNISSGTVGIQGSIGIDEPDNSNNSSVINNPTDSNGDIVILETIPPTYNKITIEDISFEVNNSDSNGTTAYDSAYVPSSEYLYVNTIPRNEYITIYTRGSESSTPPSEADARAYLDAFLPKLATAFSISTPSYEINYHNFLGDEYRSEFSLDDNKNSVLSFKHNEYVNKVVLSSENLAIDNRSIIIDHIKTDAEILESLSWVKQRLFKIFGVSFDSAKIIRKYTCYEKTEYRDAYAYANIRVCFYNTLEQVTVKTSLSEPPNSDYIIIDFSGNVSESHTVCGNNIQCLISRATNKQMVPQARFKLLPLEKAEEYLYKGYVLDVGNYCPLCDGVKAPVDFKNYDYVGISYSYSAKMKSSFPCYTFYKCIGTTETGYLKYAETSVPAVEVDGYEEYFYTEHVSH